MGSSPATASAAKNGVAATGSLRSKAVPYLFIAPAALVMLAALVYPVIHAFVLSLYDWSIGTPFSKAEFIGLEAYKRMLTDDGIASSVWVTFKFGFWTILIEMTLGVAFALMLEKPIRGASLFRTIFIMPLMISPVVVALIWRYLFDTRVGWINYYLGKLGFEPLLWLADQDLAFAAIVFTDIWQWTPFIFIIVIAGLQALPSEVLDASKIDGVNWWQQTFLIKLPMIRSILVIALLMRLIDVFRALEVMYIMTYGGPGRATELLSLHIYKTAFDGQQLGYASAISALLLVIVFMLSLVLLLTASPLKTKSDL